MLSLTDLQSSTYLIVNKLLSLSLSLSHTHTQSLSHRSGGRVGTHMMNAVERVETASKRPHPTCQMHKHQKDADCVESALGNRGLAPVCAREQQRGSAPAACELIM